jgi:hypothetical protein
LGQTRETLRRSGDAQKEEIQKIFDIGDREARIGERRRELQVTGGAGTERVEMAERDDGVELGKDMGLELLTWGASRNRRAPAIFAASTGGPDDGAGQDGDTGVCGWRGCAVGGGRRGALRRWVARRVARATRTGHR